jgi:hypothetical protein
MTTKKITKSSCGASQGAQVKTGPAGGHRPRGGHPDGVRPNVPANLAEADQLIELAVGAARAWSCCRSSSASWP